MKDRSTYIYQKSSSHNVCLFSVIVLTLIAVITISLASAADDSDSESTFTVDGIKYETTGDTTVKVISDSYSGTISIPSSVSYDSVTYSVTSIGDKAFMNCTSLTSVSIGSSVTSIGNSAFYGCTALTSVTTPESVTSLGSSVFYGCSSMTSVIILGNVRSIENSSFSWCKSLTSVAIPDSVTSIGVQAFDVCTSLTSVSIGNGVTSLDKYSFRYCTALKSVTIPDSVTAINTSAFYECKSLTSVTIGSSVTSIGGTAFFDCISLASVIIPNSVTTIGVQAFHGCTSLTSVSIGNGVTSIDRNSAFDGCTSLKEINVSEDNPSYCSVEGILFDKGKTTLFIYPTCKSNPSYTLPNEVISIFACAFCKCTSLTSVTIGNNVTSIGEAAFIECTSLTSVTIGNNVTSIGEATFGVCTSLTSITIPDSVTSIGREAFTLCVSLDNFDVSENNPNYCSMNGVLFNKEKTELIQYPLNKADQSYIIPDGVTSIDDYAFSYCTNLTSISIPKSITTINPRTLVSCTSLTEFKVSEENPDYCSVDGIIFNKEGTELIQYPAGKTDTSYTIPDSVASIDEYAFQGCVSLASVTVGKGITFIGDYAFSKCTSLISVTIPSNITAIKSCAFYECHHLVEICNDSALELTKGSFYHGGIAYYAVNIYSSKEGGSIIKYQQLEDSSVAVYYTDDSGTHLVTVNGLKRSLVLPDTLDGNKYDILDNSFNSYYLLTSVTIGSGVTSIGDKAFNNCTSLKKLYIRDCNLSECTPLDRGLRFISIKSGSSGLSELLANYTFCDSNGTVLDKDNLAGYGYELDSKGDMVRVSDPPAPSGDNSNIGLIIGCIAGAVTAILIVAFIVYRVK